jgi:phosphatidylserine/phosphatidylglycerophosphate/cardiolipin synthase-like enzyme
MITWMPKKEDKEYSFQRESLKILKENMKLENLLVKIEDKPEVKMVHAKTYIVDNIVITGSFNLTESAFHGNLERADIKLHPQTVASEKKQFEELWMKATDLSNYEIS